MSLRETINKNPKQTTAITAGIIAVAFLLIIWQACSGGGGGVGQSYYTIDDGKTYFVDASNKIPPFMKDGKEAVRAHVFVCPGGQPFVGYLEKYSPQDKKMMEDAIAGKAPPAAYAGYTGQAMVKKPNMPPTAWVPLMPGTTQIYSQIVQVTCPDGATPERVYPD